MAAFNPNEINWTFVLNLKEFVEYISLSDKLEISQLNKVCRVKLNPSLFRVIKFRLNPVKYMGFNNDLENGVTSLDQVITNFNSKQPKIKSYVKYLIIDTFFSIYKLPSLQDLFINLSFIKIFKNSVHLSAIKESFGNLKNLKSLSLEHVTLLNFQNFNINEHLLMLPNNLTDLRLNDCQIINNAITKDVNKLTYDIDREALSKSYLHLMDNYYPNLESYSIIGYNTNITEILIDFLTRNPSINSLTFSINLLTQKSLNFISELNNIENLNIEDRGFNPFLTIPIFPHIRRFKLYFLESQYNWKALEFYKSMNNLKSLTMNYVKEFTEVLSDILENSPNLKTLKIWNNLQGELELEYISNNQLKYLELFNFRQRSINSQIFTNSPNLSKLTIHKSSDKYSLTGIGYVYANNDSLTRSKVFSFKDFKDCFTIYPITNFKPSMINFDKMRLNLYYIDDFTNY